MKKVIGMLLILVLVLTLLCGCFESVEDHYGNLDDSSEENGSLNPDGTPSEDVDRVFLSIECGTILDNWDDLDPALQDEKYVPKDGIILEKTEFVIEEGTTVFDVLVMATRKYKIQMEYQGADANAFGSVYIEGINHLYEFSCGSLSGWMYLVNGTFPNYGCSKYQVKDGDVIQWVYTCDLGRDIGCDWL